MIYKKRAWGLGCVLMMLAWMGLSWASVAQAGCLVDSGTYGVGSVLRDVLCDTAGNQKTTLGTTISGENQAGNLLRVQPVGGASGGATPLRYISVGSTEDEHAVCTAQCTLYSITVTNVNAAVRYLKCENDTAANTAPGTDTPELALAVPGATTGAGFTTQFPAGALFTNGLTCWLVTGAADSDVAEVAANELMVFYTYVQ